MDTRLLILAFGTFAGATDGFVIGSLLPAIAGDSGATVAQAGYIVFGHALAYAIGAPVLAAIFGARDRRLVLAGAAVVLGISAIGIALAQGLGQAVGARVFLALGAALYGTMATATAAALSTPERRGRAIAVVVTGQSIAVALGAPLGAWVAVTYGWRVTYFGIGALAIVTGAMLFVLLPKGLTGETRTIRERLGVLQAPGLRRALFMTVAFTMGGFMVVSFILTMTTEGMGLPASLQPLVLLASGAGAIVGNQLGGQLVDRIGSYRTQLIMIIVHVMSLVSLPLIAQLPEGWVAPAYLVMRGVAGVAGWAFFTALLSQPFSRRAGLRIARDLDQLDGPQPRRCGRGDPWRHRARAVRRPPAGPRRWSHCSGRAAGDPPWAAAGRIEPEHDALDPRLIVLALGSFAGNMESVVLPVLLPAIGAETGRTLSQAGYIVFAYSIAYAISAPVLASLLGTRGSAAGAGVRAVPPRAVRRSAIALAPDFAMMRHRPIGARVRSGAVHLDVAGDGDGDRAAGAARTGGVDRAHRGTLAVLVGGPVGALVAQQFGWRVDLRADCAPRADRVDRHPVAAACGDHRRAADAARAARGARQSWRAGSAYDGRASHARWRFPSVDLRHRGHGRLDAAGHRDDAIAAAGERPWRGRGRDRRRAHHRPAGTLSHATLLGAIVDAVARRMVGAAACCRTSRSARCGCCSSACRVSSAGRCTPRRWESLRCWCRKACLSRCR